MKKSILPFCLIKGQIPTLKEQEKILGLSLSAIAYNGISMVVLDGGYPSEENGYDQKLMIMAALKHGKVINSIFGKSPLIPFRFNTGFESKKAALNWIKNNFDNIASELETLQHKYEMRLWVKGSIHQLVIENEQKHMPQTPGANYMHKKMEKLKKEQGLYAKSEEIAKSIIEKTGSFNCLDFKIKTSLNESDLFELKIDFLLSDIKESTFKEKVDSLMSLYKLEQSKVTGPWPVFHFLSERFLKSLQ